MWIDNTHDKAHTSCIQKSCIEDSGNEKEITYVKENFDFTKYNEHSPSFSSWGTNFQFSWSNSPIISFVQLYFESSYNILVSSIPSSLIIISLVVGLFFNLNVQKTWTFKLKMI